MLLEIKEEEGRACPKATLNGQRASLETTGSHDVDVDHQVWTSCLHHSFSFMQGMILGSGSGNSGNRHGGSNGQRRQGAGSDDCECPMIEMPSREAGKEKGEMEEKCLMVAKEISQCFTE